MDERMKHRLIGIIVIVSILMILAPIVLKTTEPSWHTLHRRGEFQIPQKPKPLPTVIVKKTVKEWRAPNEFKTTTLDKKPIKLTLKEVKPLPMQTHIETLPKVTLKKLTSKVTKPMHSGHIVKRPKVRSISKLASKHQRHRYHIQVATFSNQRNALSVQNRLEKMGLRSAVKQYTTKQGKQLYQVHLLESFSKDKAHRITLKMKKKFKVNSLIRRS